MPSEIFELDSWQQYFLRKYFIELGIDLNKILYKKISIDDALTALNSIKEGDTLRYLLCFFIDTKYKYNSMNNDVIKTKKLDFAIIHSKGIECYDTDIRRKYHEKDIILESENVYLLQNNEQLKQQLEDLRNNRSNNKIPNSVKRFIGPYKYNDYEYKLDKSSYETRNLQDDLLAKRLNKSVYNIKLIVEGILNIIEKLITTRLSTLNSLNFNLEEKINVAIEDALSKLKRITFRDDPFPWFQWLKHISKQKYDANIVKRM